MFAHDPKPCRSLVHGHATTAVPRISPSATSARRLARPLERQATATMGWTFPWYSSSRRFNPRAGNTFTSLPQRRSILIDDRPALSSGLSWKGDHRWVQAPSVANAEFSRDLMDATLRTPHPRRARVQQRAMLKPPEPEYLRQIPSSSNSPTTCSTRCGARRRGTTSDKGRRYDPPKNGPGRDRQGEKDSRRRGRFWRRSQSSVRIMQKGELP